MRIFCPAICRTLFLDVFPVSGRVPLIAALKERDIFITCASRYGLNPAMPGSSPRSGTDPRTRACRLCVDRLIPCVFESGHTWACFEQQTLLQRRLFSQIGRYRASGNTLSAEEHLNGTYRKPNKHSSPLPSDTWAPSVLQHPSHWAVGFYSGNLQKQYISKNTKMIY